jgi:hypothetical protein
VGRRARRHDRDAGELVPNADRAEGDDRPPGLRRRRQSRSDAHPRQGRQRAKEIELAGWDYPRHLEGRLFSVVVHGDVEGVENLRRNLSDWLCFMRLVPAGNAAELDRYIGYYKPYATSHAELDADTDVQEEVRNAARCLLEAVLAKRAGKLVTAGERLKEPRPK